MRQYYVFSIREEFLLLYQNNPSILYHILSQIKTMQKREAEYGFALFQQIARFFKKEEMDSHLFIKLHRELSYSKRGDRHLYNQFYKDEVSSLEVHHIFLKIESNKDVSSFFSFLLKENQNYFVCDFHHQDYFWLNDLKILV